MAKHLFQICLLGLFLLTTHLSNAQNKKIIISDDLSNNAEELKVKVGTAWFGKIWKFKFGDYEVGKSKLGWTTTNQKSNLLNTKTESNTENKFSFVLNNKSSEEAIVNAMIKVEVEELQSFELFPNFFVGNNEVLSDSHFFSSLITTTSKMDETWVMIMAETYDSDTGYKYEAFLRNSDRTISIIPTSSNKNGGDARTFPALGYEFIENNKSLGAMQYFGGGALGYNKNIVWLRSDLDERMKLILAAAMTSVLQFKSP